MGGYLEYFWKFGIYRVVYCENFLLFWNFSKGPWV